MDTTTLMMMMMMSGGRSNNMLPLMLLMNPGMFGNILTPQAMTVAMLPVGAMGKMLLGGAGAVIAGQLFNKPKKKTYRKRTYFRRSYRRY